MPTDTIKQTKEALETYYSISLPSKKLGELTTPQLINEYNELRVIYDKKPITKFSSRPIAEELVVKAYEKFHDHHKLPYIKQQESLIPEVRISHDKTPKRARKLEHKINQLNKELMRKGLVIIANPKKKDRRKYTEIIVKTTKNPRKKGPAKIGYDLLLEKLSQGIILTVQQYLEQGGRLVDLNRYVKAGNLELKVNEELKNQQ